MTSRPSWDAYGLALAATVASRADCSRRQVGAVIMDAEHRIVSTGYNGAPAGDVGCLAGGCPRATSDVAAGDQYETGPGRCVAVHAEHNAVLYARRDLRGMTLYVTCPPCDQCATMLRAVGIERIVTP